MMNTLKTGDVCAKHDNECVCVTNNLILAQDSVDHKIATKNHTMISPEKRKPMNKQEIYKYKKNTQSKRNV